MCNQAPKTCPQVASNGPQSGGRGRPQASLWVARARQALTRHDPSHETGASPRASGDLGSQRRGQRLLLERCEVSAWRNQASLSRSMFPLGRDAARAACTTQGEPPAGTAPGSLRNDVVQRDNRPGRRLDIVKRPYERSSTSRRASSNILGKTTGASLPKHSLTTTARRTIPRHSEGRPSSYAAGPPNRSDFAIWPS